MSLIPRESTGDGDYYLAPSVKFAKVGLGNHVEELVYVDENGDNHYGLENIFKTELKTFGLNLYYDSSNARDNYSTIGHWRHSFVSRLDFDINEADLKDKSNFYETPREACESGFNDIKEDIYRGILSSATSVYDKKSDMCIIKQDGEDVGKFLVWNRVQKRDDAHYLTTDTGEFLVFVKNSDGAFTTEQNGIKITLSEDVNGTFSYKDDKDVLRRYDTNGRLVYLMDEGQETTVEYNTNGDVSKVVGPLANYLHFSYENGNLKQITTSVENMNVITSFTYDNNKMLDNIKQTIVDENNTENVAKDMMFGYNDRNLLSSVTSDTVIIDENDTLPAFSLNYEYDNLNRANTITSDANTLSVDYTANKIIKTLPNGTTATADVSFKGGKQVISTIEDQKIQSDYDYNTNGQMSNLIVEEEVTVEPDENGSNIQSNVLSTAHKSLNIQVDYNERGLINSQYLETSDGTKKFTNFEYKTKYNKPTKILTDEEVVFFDFNNKGQLIRKSYLQFDKDMKIKPYTLDEIKQEEGYEEYTYSYDSNGFLSSEKNEIDGDTTHYMTLANGKTIQGNIEAARFGKRSDPAGWQSRITKGHIGGKIYNIRDGKTRTAFVSGAGDIGMAGPYKSNKYITDAKHYTWWEISYYNTWKSDIFEKGNKDTLIVLGHSYGGDSSMKAACKDNVNLLVTVDPVGHNKADTKNVASKTDFWINIHSDPGRQWAYLKIDCGCKRKGWKFYCKCTAKWLDSQWSAADWIAWWGGKYNSINNADDNIKVSCHHNQIGKMLRAMRDNRRGYDINMAISNKSIW